MVAVVRRPVEFVVAVGLVYRVLRLVAARIDECKRLTGHEALVRSIAVSGGRVGLQFSGRKSAEKRGKAPHGETRWQIPAISCDY